MEFGFTEIEAVGAAAGGGGGGGGGGAAFFAHAPSAIRAPSATDSRTHFLLCCFTLFLLADPNQSLRGQTKCVYFQLQFGCVLRPVKVSCCSLLPSASMVQISSLPDRLD